VEQSEGSAVEMRRRCGEWQALQLRQALGTKDER
jgi:hypothetical protein